MKNTLDLFSNSLQKTDIFLKDIEAELDWKNGRNRVYSLFKAVIQTLRDRLTVNEAADFASQLPLILKGVYYDGWRPAKAPIKFNRAEFISEVERKFPTDPEVSTEDLIRAVLKVLEKHVDKGEMDEVRHMLPREFNDLF